MRIKKPAKALIIAIVVILVVLGTVTLNYLNKQDKTANFTPQPPTTNGQAKTLVVLGSSTAKANNLSSDLPGDNPDYSFAAGTKIDSLYLCLKRQDKSLAAVNLAESGANSDSVLQKQVPQAISHQPEFVVIDIMADILEDSTPDNLKRNLNTIIGKIKNENTIILIGSYPNLPFFRSASYPSCQEDGLGIGIDRLTTTKVQDFNQMLRQFANDNNLIFVDLYRVLAISDISDYDCLHPNIAGQKKLAKAWIDALEKRR
jgi:lysophospholipase L1-like esterase